MGKHEIINVEFEQLFATEPTFKEVRLAVETSPHIVGIVYSDNLASTNFRKFVMRFKCPICCNVFNITIESVEMPFTSGYIKCLKN